MDPQQRGLLEQVFAGLSDARCNVSGFDDSNVGTYVGCMYQEYTQLQFNLGGRINPAVVTGNGISYLVGRVAYTFGFTGPTVSIDTACSSSLVAAHLARSGLLAGETTMAVAGGVNAMLLPITTASIAGMSALSPVARCRTFDASADGYGRGEGFAALILSCHQSSSDAPLILVRGTAVNQGGRSSGLTAPNGPSQSALIRSVLAAAEANVYEVAYISLHGTGTPLGDPIEMNALGVALRQPATVAGKQTGGSGPVPTTRTLTVGSVKSCFGHTEGAAGLTGVILAAHAMRLMESPGIMHLRTVNPYVASAISEWQRRQVAVSAPRQRSAQAIVAHNVPTAGTSSFGMGGTNAHLLLTAPSSNEARSAGGLSRAFQKSVLWPAPPTSRFLSAALIPSRNKHLVMMADLLRPSLGYLYDHCVGGHPLLPGAALVEMALAAAATLGGRTTNESFTALGCTIPAPVVLSGHAGAMHLQVTVDLTIGKVAVLGIPPQTHCTTRLGNIFDKDSQQTRFTGKENFSVAPIFRSIGLNAFIFPGAVGAVGYLEVDVHDDYDGYCISPRIFDGALHVGASLGASRTANSAVSVPTGMAAVSVGYSRSGKERITRLNATCQILPTTRSTKGINNDENASNYQILGACNALCAVQDLLSKPIAVHKLQSKSHGALFPSKQAPSTISRSQKPSAPQHVLYEVRSQISSVAPVLGAALWKNTAPLSLALSSQSISTMRVSVMERAPLVGALSAFMAAVQQGPGGLQGGRGGALDLITTGGLPRILAPNTPAGHPSVVPAAVWGMARVAASEAPTLAWSGVDVAGVATYRGLTRASMISDDLSGASIEFGALRRPLLLPVTGSGPQESQLDNSVFSGRAVVTGGLGGLGLLLATWLGEYESTSELLLLGRSGIFADGVQTLRDCPAAVTAMRSDVGAAADVDDALRADSSQLMPLSAVFHAGGVLRDGVIARQTAASIRAVAAPKFGFATRALSPCMAQPIDCINIFSSVSAFLGSPGQSNYAAANAALDDWAHWLVQSGLAGSTVQWGAWIEVGMAHKNTAVLSRVENSGLGVIGPAAGLGALTTVLRARIHGGLVQTIASPFDFRVMLQGLQNIPAIFDAVLESEDEEPAAADASVFEKGHHQPSPAKPSVDVAAIADAVSQSVKKLIGTDVASDTPLLEAGLDSLGAVEMRNELGNAFAITMPATVVFDYPSIASMTTFIASALSPAADSNPTKSNAVLTVEPSSRSAGGSTAIMGVTCRYPENVLDTNTFVKAASGCVELLAVIPYSRWDIDRMYAPAVGVHGAIYSRFGAFIDDVESFDGHLFNLPRGEALYIDPQQRLLLEETYVALQQNNGQLSRKDTGTGVCNFTLLYFYLRTYLIVESYDDFWHLFFSIGVYVGCMYHEYSSVLGDVGSGLTAAAATGNSPSFMVGRLSYCFGLSGPCISTDTACSSSLVATHLGNTSIQMRESSAAVAAGVNLVLSATTTAAICLLQALSPVGRCKTLDAEADGYGRGEGVVVVILGTVKSDHKNASDPLALLRTTTVNQDGRSSSLTAPNGPSQTTLISEALIRDGNNHLTSMALHGTGTPLGDPIEISALGQALTKRPRDKSAQLTLSSVKSCYNHVEGAAGLTGLLLAMATAEHAMGLPCMHLRNVNPYVGNEFENWGSHRGLGAAVPRQTAGVWHGGVDALAGTSSFGMSGVNAYAAISVPEIHSWHFTENVQRAALQRKRVWPMPKLTTVLHRVVANRQGKILYECNLHQANLAFVHEVLVKGRPVVAPAVFIELLVASGAVAINAGEVLATNIVFSKSSILANGLDTMLHCNLDEATGRTRITNNEGVSAVESALSYMPPSEEMRLPRPLSACTKAGALIGYLPNSTFEAVGNILLPPAGRSGGCNPCASQASLTLAMVAACQPSSTLSTCAAWCAIPCNRVCVERTPVPVVASSNTLAFHGHSRAFGLSSASIAELHRHMLVTSDASPAWELRWYPTPVSHDDNTSPALWLTFSIEKPFSLAQVLAPSLADHTVSAMNVCWKGCENSPPVIDEEIVVSDRAHIEWLLHSCRSNLVFVVSPPPNSDSMRSQNSVVEQALAMYQSILLRPLTIQVSLLTFGAHDVPPFATVQSPVASILTSIARTVFLEQRERFAPSVDFPIDSRVDVVTMMACVRRPGEYGMAIRAGRTYRLQLVRAREPRGRLQSGISSAFVAGGTKVSICNLLICFCGIVS